MKKRIISMLLTVLMVMSLFSGLTVSADAATYNGANTIEYTMAQGDFVLRICQKLGLNYYTCKQAIMALNNIQDGQWNKLTVGRTLILPASDYDALLISNGAGTTVYNSGAAVTTATTSNVTGTATTGTATVVNTAAAAASADTLAYYLVPYTMSYGETVSGVCNALGVNFSIFSPFIKQVNNVSNWNKVYAGDTLLIPTPVAPAVGTTCYGVMQHIVASSDTAYGITASKGINYSANERLLKVLNQTENLAAIKAGDKFFYPVPLTVSVPGTGNPGSTATTTTTTTVTDGNGTTTTSTTTTAKLYKLSSGMATSDGTMLFYVDNKPVTAAPAGAKVTVVTDTFDGKAIQSLTVKQSNGKADFLLAADTFVMPGCDVRVDASVKSGYDINIEANYSGKASASVGGVSVQAAVKGATVVVKSTDPNYEISSIYVYYRKLVSSSNKTEVKHSSSNAFIMPDMPVTVEVVLKPVATYAFYVNSPDNGSFYLKVDGSPVIRAAKGAQVTLVAEPDPGYVAGYITVSKHGDSTKFVNFFNNTFTMPAFDVDVHVSFIAKGDNILIMPAVGGDALAYAAEDVTINVLTDKITSTPTVDTSEAITERGAGEWVALKDFPETGYTLDPKATYEIVRNSDGLKVKAYPKEVDSVWYYFFKMPKGGVTVTPHFVGAETYAIWPQIYLNGDPVYKYSDCSFSATINGTKTEFLQSPDLADAINTMKLNAVPYGQFVDLRYDSSDGYSFLRYEVYTADKIKDDTPGKDHTWALDEELTNQASLHGYFDMPNKHVVVRAYFESGKAALGPAVIEGIGSVGYKVYTKVSDFPPAWDWRSANTCEPGDTVMVIVTAGNGYKFDATKYNTKLLVTRKDNGAPIPISTIAVPSLDPNSFAFTFEMPATGADIRAIFDPKPFTITMKCVDEVGNDLTGLGLWQIAIDWVPGVVDNATGISWFDFVTKFDVAYGDYVTVAMTEAGWSKYDMVSFRVDDKEYTADELNYFYNFQMIEDRAKDMTITAVLRPKQVGIHNLTALYDVTKGGVEFLIIDSPSKYSNEFRRSPNVDGANLKYINKAVTGDKVAIVANSIDSQYYVKASDITVTAWADDSDRIVPTEQWIYANGLLAVPNAPGAVRVFTFTMPDSDVYVNVNISGTKQGLAISVYDTDNNPLNGMVRVAAVSTTGAAISRDVAADVSFDDVAFNSTVSILRSELALAQKKVIQDVEISTASGKSVPYTDMSNAGEGIMFTMPNEPVWVIIRMADFNYGLPLYVVEHITGGHLVFRHSEKLSDPVVTLSDFATGETVYVFDEPDSGYDHLGLGDLKVLANGVTNIANCIEPTTVPHIWTFTMPEGTLILEADFPKEGTAFQEISIKVQDTGGTELTDVAVEATLNGYTSSFKSGDSFKAAEGQIITFAPADGYAFHLIESASHKGLDGISYTVPDDLTSAEVLTFTVVPKPKNDPVKVKITTDHDVVISSSAASGVVSTGTKDFDLPVGETITVVSNVDGLSKIKLTSGSGKGVNGNQYTVPDLSSDTLTIAVSAAGNPINSSVGANGEVQFYADTAMTTPIVSSSVPTDASVYIKVTPKPGYEMDTLKVTDVVGGKEETLTGTNPYVLAKMPEGGINVTTTFKAKSLMINLRILDKSKVGENVSSAAGLTTPETVYITVNGTRVKYADKDKIDVKTAQKLVFESKASEHVVSSIQSYKSSDLKAGTKITSLNYTVVGEEAYMVIFVDTTKKASSDDTVLELVEDTTYDSAEPVTEYIEGAEEAAVPETEAADEAEGEVEIPDYPKIESGTETAPAEEEAPAEGEA